MNQVNNHNPFRKAGEIKLTDKESGLIRNNILNFIRTESVRQALTKDIKTNANRNWLRLLGLRQESLAYRVVPMVLVLTVLISGGTTFAAQSSLPGDILYPIKVDLTEKVQGALALSDEDKANWEAKLAERRLVEAEELASNGRLNEKTSAELERRLTEHTRASARLVLELNTKSESESAAKVTSSLEASLEVHEKILADISNKESGKNTPSDTSDDQDSKSEQIRPILDAIRTDLSAVTKSRVKTETEMSARAETEKQKSSERAMRDASTHIRDTENFIQKNKSLINEGAYTQATDDLKISHNALSDGEASVESKEYAEAFTSFQESIRASQKVRLSVEAAIRSETRNKAKQLQEDRKNRQESRRKNSSPKTSSPDPSVSPTKSPKPSESEGSFLRRMAPSPTPLVSAEVETKIKIDDEGSDSEIKLEVEGTGSVGL